MRATANSRAQDMSNEPVGATPGRRPGTSFGHGGNRRFEEGFSAGILFTKNRIYAIRLLWPDRTRGRYGRFRNDECLGGIGVEILETFVGEDEQQEIFLFESAVTH
jgi:hypothetical protein